MTPIRPKTIANPKDMMSKIELKLIPRKIVSMAPDHEAHISIRSIAPLAARDGLLLITLLRTSRRAAQQFFQRRQGVLAPQLAELGRRRNLRGRILGPQFEELSCFLHRIAYPAVRLAHGGLFQPRDRDRLAEHPQVRRRGTAGVRILAG